MNIEINLYKSTIYYNVYMIKLAYFGCGIVKLTIKEEIELKRIYEGLLLNKLGFSKNFSRVVLYAQKSAFEIKLIKP